MPETKTEATQEQKDKVLQTINDLNDALKNIPENVDGLAERMEKVEKQLVEVQKVWEEPIPRKQAISYAQTGDFTDVKYLVESKGVVGLEEAAAMPISAKASESVQRFKLLWDNLWITHNLLSHPDVIKEKGKPYSLNEIQAFKDFEQYLDVMGIKDALATSLAGAGLEWVPQIWSSEMTEYYRLARNVPEIFTEIDMPSETYQWPLQTTPLSVYNASQSTSTNPTAITASRMNTAKVTFTAQKPAVRMLWSGELDEDSIIPILPTLRQEIPAALAEAREDCIINGVKSGTTHLDSDIEANDSDDHRKMWYGMRYHANQQSAEYDVTTGTTAYAYSDHAEVQSLMGKYAGFDSPSEKFTWIASMKAYLKAGAFDELTKANHVTAQYATILRGTVNFINGSPVLVSDKVRQDLDSGAATYTSGGTDTIIIGVHRPSFRKGMRRRQTLEVTRIARTDQYEVVAITREDFEAMHTNLSSGESLVGVGYAIS
ncbi:hypothetical protein H8E77_24950 [bacterium]|nr:hypothetical protein [bacterium]